MTKEQTYQQLKKIIVDKLPEILDLKRGCKVKDVWDDNKIVDVVGNWKRKDKKGDIYSGVWLLNDRFACFESQILKHQILGREIDISDVLRVIGDKYAINGDGLFAEIIQGEWRQFDDCKWQLGKSLENQSEEFYDFLLDILK